MIISEDKRVILDSLYLGQAVLIKGEAGTGKTLLGLLCGKKLLASLKPWQKVLYLTYSKLAKRQISECLSKLKDAGLVEEGLSGRFEILNYHSLWWNLLRANYRFLGVTEQPRMQRKSERDCAVDAFLDHLKTESKIPQFLTKKGEVNKNEQKYLRTFAAGKASVFSRWCPQDFGQLGRKFKSHYCLIEECDRKIRAWNKIGLFWHSETICWADTLLKSHPNVLRLLKARFPVMIIDEFQDTDEAQWDMVKLMAPETIIAFGDPRQTIHKWRGANDQRLGEFEGHFGNYSHTMLTHSLVTKHRSGQCGPAIDWQTITDQPSRRLEYTIGRKVKSLILSNNVEFKAILCKTNDQVTDLCNYLREKQRFKKGGCLPPLDVRVMGAENSPSETIRELVSLLNEFVINQGAQELQGFISNALLRDVLPLPKSKLPKYSQNSRGRNKERWVKAGSVATSLSNHFAEGLHDLAEFLEEECTLGDCNCDDSLLKGLRFIAKAILRAGKKRWNALSALDKQFKIDGYSLQFEEAIARYEPRISIQTVHQAKGREYDVVIIPWFVGFGGIWPVSDEKPSLDLEEINVFHTACTRAKKKVIVLSSKTMIDYLQSIQCRCE